MVIDTNTMEPLHELSNGGYSAWCDYVDKEEEFKAYHPLRWLLEKISRKFT